MLIPLKKLKQPRNDLNTSNSVYMLRAVLQTEDVCSGLCLRGLGEGSLKFGGKEWSGGEVWVGVGERPV